MKKTSRAYLKILFIIVPIGYLLAIYARTAWLAIEGLIGMDIPDILWVAFTLLAFSLFIKFVVGDIMQIIEQDREDKKVNRHVGP